MNKQKIITDAGVILEKAAKAFIQTTGIKFSIKKLEKAALAGSDLLVTVSLGNHPPASYEVEVKTNLHSAAVLSNVGKFQNPACPRLLAATYISPGVAESLKKLDVQFMDTAGNVYLKTPELYIYVNKHGKPDNMFEEKSVPLFLPSGLKFIFVCLADAVNGNPENRLGNLKKLAETSGISLGSASYIRRELVDQGYLIETARGVYELQDRARLLENWVNAYADKLHPKLLTGRYRSLEPQWWKNAELDSDAFLWGGEVAAAKLTGYLFPEIITIYAAGSPNKLISKMGLQVDKNGSVEIRSIFWNSKNYYLNGCVHPLLVYADLLASNDNRNIETAKMIYKSYLSNAIDAD